MNKNEYVNYIHDLISILIEKAQDAKVSSQIDCFESGRSMAYYEVLSLIKDQAIVFNLELDKIGLENLIPENYLFQKDT